MSLMKGSNIMLNMNNEQDFIEMKNYYRTSDMLNLLYFFPNLSPIKHLTIVKDEDDYINNKEYLERLDQNRVDTLKGKVPIFGVENSGGNNTFYDALLKVKEKDPNGVLVLFNGDGNASERYERYAGISVRVDLGNDVIIEAVSKGFDGREVNKSICTHERYFIPWFDLRKVCLENFKTYQIYQINNEQYQKTRKERILFLKSVGLNEEIVSNCIPVNYQPIPDFIWQSVIENLLKQLEKNEYLLESYGFNNFTISGHTEGKSFSPWQTFDKSRYSLVRKK
jgi:hypothetical protein